MVANTWKLYFVDRDVQITGGKGTVFVTFKQSTNALQKYFVIGIMVFSSPCQRQWEFLPSLGVCRMSNGSALTVGELDSGLQVIAFLVRFDIF